MFDIPPLPLDVTQPQPASTHVKVHVPDPKAVPADVVERFFTPHPKAMWLVDPLDEYGGRSMPNADEGMGAESARRVAHRLLAWHHGEHRCYAVVVKRWRVTPTARLASQRRYSRSWALAIEHDPSLPPMLFCQYGDEVWYASWRDLPFVREREAEWAEQRRR